MACLCRRLIRFNHLNPARLLSTSPVMLAKRKAGRDKDKKTADRFMTKLMMKAKVSNRKPWYSQGLSQPGSVGGPSFLRTTNPSTKRAKGKAHQLSVVFYEFITNVINSGEVNERLAEIGVDILKVRIPPDFNIINVHWAALGTERDEEVEMLLKQSEGKVRKLLDGKMIMNNLPRVQFVRDTTLIKQLEVNRLLDMIDFGPGFVGTDPADALREVSTHQIESNTFGDNVDFDNQGVHRVAEGAHGDLQRLHRVHSDLQGMQFGFHSDSSRMHCDNNSASEMTEDLSKEMEADFGNLNLRDDILDIDHGSMVEKLMSTKQKAQSRFKDSDIFSEANISSDDVHRPIEEYKALLRKNKLKEEKAKGSLKSTNKEKHRLLDPSTWQETE